jgi:hypothetical protein
MPLLRAALPFSTERRNETKSEVSMSSDRIARPL